MSLQFPKSKIIAMMVVESGSIFARTPFNKRVKDGKYTWQFL
jgi:hypothetical protein